MRIMVKGGVWKNTEDEILKAAVMKYGKNQWARISSLLVRKSAKQCKTRWYEWLDPSIKKTEWSREEEEKLLHLAKIMPNQWRTIAPLIGRTASQCIEHYEKLLDAAQNKGESYDPSDDPRRLRPGEIDPNPEAKPAKPDPVDMDEDEKEMLSEARARLANTKGKKAKRKAREKQLEEARRIAALQKRRELKAAGIDLPKPRKKIKGIDYNAEIPFFKKPPPGFYEVNYEEEKKDSGFKRISLHELDNASKRRKEEDNARKDDQKKQKAKEKKNLPLAIMQMNKLNDPDTAQSNRSRLMLPSPQLDEKSLEEFAKMGETGSLIPIDEDDSNDSKKAATKNLLQTYSATPTPYRGPNATPAHGSSAAHLAMRTPLPTRTPMREDNIMREAQNLIALTTGQTPLAGGENPILHPSDFSGVTPKVHDMKTPNVLATPLRGGAVAPSVRMGAIANTPLRDKMGINSELALMESKAEVRQKEAALRKQLQSGLRSLPAPQNEYDLMLPEIPEDFDGNDASDNLDEDASDALARAQKIENEREQMRLRLRSQVLKREGELPRPIAIVDSFADFTSRQGDSLLKQAEEMLREEMISLITHEAVSWPFKGSKIGRNKYYHPGYDSEFHDSEILNAGMLINKEVEELKAAHGWNPQDFEKVYNETADEFVFVPSQQKFVRSTALTKKEKLEAVMKEFEDVKSLMGKEAMKAKKMEEKLNIYNGGYQKRANGLLDAIQKVHQEIVQVSSELNAFKNLRELERKAMPSRIEGIATQVREQEEREAENQRRYRNLIIEKQNLLAV